MAESEEEDGATAVQSSVVTSVDEEKSVSTVVVSVNLTGTTDVLRYDSSQMHQKSIFIFR